MCRLNDVNNLHMLACSYHMPATFYFIFIFYKYQNTSDPTQNLQKIQSEKNTNTSKDKNICFKIQGYFSNITVLKN